MKNFIDKMIFTALFFAVLSSTAYAVPAGHIDFEKLSKHYGDARVEVNLSKNLIGMVSSLAHEEDPEAAEILSKLEFVKVRIYDLNGDIETATKTITEVTKVIKKDNWENIITVNEDDEKVRIFSKTTDNKIEGIIVMIVTSDTEKGGEAVFINIVGEIDPAKIAKVTQSLNINMSSN